MFNEVHFAQDGVSFVTVLVECIKLIGQFIQTMAVIRVVYRIRHRKQQVVVIICTVTVNSGRTAHRPCPALFLLDFEGNFLQFFCHQGVNKQPVDGPVALLCAE